MNKKAILELVIQSLQAEEKILTEAALSAKQGATDPEAKPENKYDTRGLEQSYLAGAQAKRAAEMKVTISNFMNLMIQKFDKLSLIDISALIELTDENDDVKTYFILPERGGMKVQFLGQEIATLSPESPLAEALLGKKMGDTIEVKTKGKTVGYTISKVT